MRQWGLLLLLPSIARGLQSSHGGFPVDAVRAPYVGDDWHYYFRPNGHQTSTDDVLVAAGACKPWLVFGSGSDENAAALTSSHRYLDLGTGIGSTLLLVAYNAMPLESVGIESQAMSYEMLSRTLSELKEAPPVRAVHGDLRDHATLLPPDSTFHCITANPPFTKLGTGPLCQDEQRTYARFELRGGIEEYCDCAAKLLAPDGRFVVAFWHKDDGLSRVKCAAAASGLQIKRRTDVIGGAPDNTVPHISVFELVKGQEEEERVHELNLTRDPFTGGIGKRYREIQRGLSMRPRPLKSKSIATR